MDKLRKIRIVLTEILSADASYILQHVHQEDLVTPREYRDLHNVSQEHPEESIVSLLNSLLMKGGDEKCTRFLTLLQKPVIRSTYSKLGEIKHIDIAPAPSSPAPPDAVPTSASSTVHTHRPTTSGSKIPTTPVKKNNRRRTTACGTITDVSEVKMGKAGGEILPSCSKPRGWAHGHSHFGSRETKYLSRSREEKVFCKVEENLIRETWNEQVPRGDKVHKQIRIDLHKSQKHYKDGTHC